MFNDIIRPNSISYDIPVGIQTLVSTNEDEAFELEKEFMEQTEMVFHGSIKSWDCTIEETKMTFYNFIWEEV